MGPIATILIVDDEPEVREMLEDYLVTHGFETVCAESASAARELALSAQTVSKPWVTR